MEQYIVYCHLIGERIAESECLSMAGHSSLDHTAEIVAKTHTKTKRKKFNRIEQGGQLWASKNQE
jgi:hypothetical protein